jgi:MFS transporter, FSR family, fosmidomycin resistance protein
MGGANVGRLAYGARPHRGLCLSREVRLLWATICRGRIALAFRRTSRFLLTLVYSNVPLWQEPSRHPGERRRRKDIFHFLPSVAIWYNLHLMSSQRAHQQNSPPVPRGGGVPAQAPAAGLIWLVGLSHATNHLAMLIFPSVLLLVQREFALSYVELGILANAGLLCYGLGALPAGMLADRIGGMRVLAIWLLGGSLACIGVGLSTGPWTLGVGLAVLGLCASLHHPAGSGVLVVLRQALGTNVGRAFGRLGILGNVGLAAAPIFATAIGTRWGWRAAFWAGAIPGFLLAIPMWQYFRLFRPPEVARCEVSPVERRSIRSAFTLPLLLLFGLETLMGFVFQGFTTFLPTYLAGQAGIDGLTVAQVRRGGSFASIALLFGGLGHLAAGRLMKSSRREVIFLASVVFNALCLFGMGVTQGFPLLLFSITLSFTHFALSTMGNTFMAFQTPPSLGGTAFGITFALSFGIGSLASSSMGLVAQRLGLPVVFLVLGGVAIGGAALVAWFGLATGAWSTGRMD